MRARVLLLPCLLVVGGAWWLRRGEEAPVHRAAPPVVAAAPPPSAPTLPPAPPPRIALAAPAPPTAESLGAARLDPSSNAFRQRLDEVIPGKLFAEAARCYKGGLKQDQRLDLTYRIHVEDGAISVTDVRVDADTLGDAQLSRCIRDQLLATKLKDNELPDVEEEDDLFISGDSLKPYLSSADPPAGSNAVN